MDAEVLFDSCLPLMWRIVHSFRREHPSLADDFESDSMLALWQAATRNDPTRAKFTTFAGIVVRHACLGVLDKAKRRPAALSLHTHDADDPDPAATVAAIQPAVGAALEARDELDRLPPDLLAEAELALEGFAEKDIDAAAGITRQGRRDRRKRILARLAAPEPM